MHTLQQFFIYEILYISVRDKSQREKTQTSNTQDIKREKKQKQTNRLQIGWEQGRKIKSTRTKLFIKKIIKKLI